MRLRKGQNMRQAAQQVSFLPAGLFTHRLCGVESQKVEGLELVTNSNSLWALGGRGMARMTCHIFLKSEENLFPCLPC